MSSHRTSSPWSLDLDSIEQDALVTQDTLRELLPPPPLAEQATHLPHLPAMVHQVQQPTRLPPPPMAGPWEGRPTHLHVSTFHILYGGRHIIYPLFGA